MQTIDASEKDMMSQNHMHVSKKCTGHMSCAYGPSVLCSNLVSHSELVQDVTLFLQLALCVFSHVLKFNFATYKLCYLFK